MKIASVIFFTLLSTAMNAQTWTAVGAGINSENSAFDGTVETLLEFNGVMFAGGYFSKAADESANNIATWKGTRWSAAGSGVDFHPNVLVAYNFSGKQFDL